MKGRRDADPAGLRVRIVLFRNALLGALEAAIPLEVAMATAFGGRGTVAKVGQLFDPG